MRFPLEGLIDPPDFAPFKEPVDRPFSLLHTWARGGVALNDTSEGLEYQNWEFLCPDPEVGNIYIFPEGSEGATPFRTYPGVEEISGTFDQNMNPLLVYMLNGGAYLDWFDVSEGKYVTMPLEEGARSPKIMMDDHRKWFISQGESNLFLAYVHGDSVYYRMHSERYTIRYVLAAGLAQQIPDLRLDKLGMAENMRLQFQLSSPMNIVRIVT